MFAYRASTSFIPLSSTSTVVDALPVTQSGNYVVNATATTIKDFSGLYVACRIVDASSRGSVLSPTPFMYNNTNSTYGTIAVDGAMRSERVGSTIEERCKTDAPRSRVSALDATMDDVLVTRASSPAAPTRKPTNTFQNPAPAPSSGSTDRVGG
jgi:hypothetical protein